MYCWQGILPICHTEAMCALEGERDKYPKLKYLEHLRMLKKGPTHKHQSCALDPELARPLECICVASAVKTKKEQ